MLIVFSDLLEDRDETLKALSMCIHRGGEVILFHILHTDELRLPPVENGIFIDSESWAKIRLNVEDIRDAHRSLGVGNDDELGVEFEVLQEKIETLIVRLVQGGIDLIQEAEGSRLGFENGKL